MVPLHGSWIILGQKPPYLIKDLLVLWLPLIYTFHLLPKFLYLLQIMTSLYLLFNKRDDSLLLWQCFMILHCMIPCLRAFVGCFLDHLGLHLEDVALYICYNVHVVCTRIFFGDGLMTLFDLLFASNVCLPSKEDKN